MLETEHTRFLDASKDLGPQHLAKFFIEIKKSHRRPSDRGQSDNLHAGDSGIQHSRSEVIGPFIGSRMKEASKFARFWIDARQVCPLLQIALPARERKIFQLR
jgi:hypothetical protein